ncbi:MAG: rRNA maturation RNase YbeY [Treponema sp.]|jgi:probable rRNA maturation factor|nr:rRNA maturation RNase YbeY [Treponema sp.]
MNRVDVSAAEVPLPPWKGRAKSFILKVLKTLRRDGWDLSVLFCGDRYIKTLNARYRNKDEATDVLSFALGETAESEKGNRYLPGDIVISLETLEENAGYFGVSRDEELRRLLVHGILHLDGMDHATNKPGEPMLRLQEKILTQLAGERIT